MKKITVFAVFILSLCAFAIFAGGMIESEKQNSACGSCNADIACENVLVCNQEIAARSGVEINEINFPDRVFREWLRDPANISGAGSDGILTAQELESVKDITYRGTAGNQIADLTGVQYFGNLINLSVPYNALTALDIGNSKIEYLNCSYNALKELSITRLANLRSLNCEFNYLDKLDLSGNPALVVLYCRHNVLQSLDLSNNTELVFIETFDNKLEEIDVSMLSKLEFLHIDHNRLTFLDMSKNLNLKGGGFVVRNNDVRKLILPEIDGFTVYYDDFAEQDPIKGYEKSAWFADEEFTVPVESDVIAEGQTLYAKRIPNAYSVIFSADGASNVPANVSTYYDEYFNIPDNVPVRTGYEFLCWSDSKYSQGQQYSPGQQLINISGARYDGEKITLYAKWQGVGYRISFDKNSADATGDMQTVDAVYGTSSALPSNAFQRQGYDFEGWSLSRDGKVMYKDSQSVVNLTTQKNDVITLYAVWSENAQTLQQPYIDKVKAEFESYEIEDYYHEDANLLTGVYNNAVSDLKQSGKDTALMQKLVLEASQSMAEVANKTNRAQEIAYVWRQNNQLALQYVGDYPIPLGEAELRLDAVKNAINTSDINELVSLSSLTDERDRESAAYEAAQMINKDTEGFVAFVNAAQWLCDAQGICMLSLKEIKPEHTEECDKLLLSYKKFSEPEKQYVPEEAANGVFIRSRIALCKKQSIEKVNAMSQSVNKEEYSEDNYNYINTIIQNGVQSILSASSEEEIDYVVASVKDKIESVPKGETDINPPQELPDISDGGTRSAIYAFVIAFVASATACALFFAIYLRFRNAKDR